MTHPCPHLDRRELLRRLAALGLLTGAAGILAACDTHSDGDMPMMGSPSPSGSAAPGWMMNDGAMMDPAKMGDMATIMDLLTHHDLIKRSVQDVDGGIRSATTSADPRIAGLIRTHVAAMHTRITEDRPVRQGDPLFREIFKRHANITITTQGLPDGIQVTETSTDPQVTLLIRAHARNAVSEFVANGMARAMQPTPLPAGYRS